MKKENHPKLQKKGVSKVRIPNLLVIIVERKCIQLMFVGARMLIKMQSQSLWLTITSATKNENRHMNARPEPKKYLNLKDTATTFRSMDIEHLSVDLSLHGH